MRFKTESGAIVTAPNKARAQEMARAYGMGEVVGAADAAPIKPLPLAKAMRLWEAAQEWPRCAQGWPRGQKETAAEAAIAQREAAGDGWTRQSAAMLGL